MVLDDERFHCLGCSRSYKHEASLRKHMKYECGKPPQFACHICRRKFTQKDEFCCRSCHKSYKSKRSLLRHAKYQCKQEPSFYCTDSPYSCCDCGKSYKCRQSLWRHSKFQCGNRKPSFGYLWRHVCQTCGKSYKNRTSLNRHVKYECMKEPQFECPVCHHKSYQRANLFQHVRIKHRNLDTSLYPEFTRKHS
ncbi:zinc finger protein 2-like [Cylas formicarius]|uniref:zinc finger protein 2-like n=1 Tax=Cylas formicarius TaxID=197179 RepID=UPI0029589BA0|nr:zinc finger protein 2-like [Cylas formicarius]